MTRPFESLSPEEVLALAIHVERANAGRFRAFADVFEGYDPQVAARFQELAEEEDQHEVMLTERFNKHFGATIPMIDEVEVEGVIESPDIDDGEPLIFDSLRPAEVYRLAHRAEVGAQEYYRQAVERTTDGELKKLYQQLAAMEDEHAGWLENKLQELEARGGDS